MVKKLHQQHFYTSVGQCVSILFLDCLNGKVNARLLEMAICFNNHFFRVLYLQKAVFFAQILQRQFTLGYVCCTFENVVVSEFFVVFLLYTYAAIWVKTRYPNSYLLLKKQLQGIFFMNLIHFIEIWNQGRIVLILVGFLLKWKLRTSLPQH